MEYGFIYIWRDKKHKKLYVGCHWGTETDGYVCSSTNMRNNYRNRPHDFRRKIVQRVYTNRQDLLEAEHKWLQLIPDNELGRKFYNKSKHRFGHWTAREDKQEIQRVISQTTKIAYEIDPTIPARQEASRQKKRQEGWDPRTGKLHSVEAKNRMREANLAYLEANPEHRKKKMADLAKGKEKMAAALKSKAAAMTEQERLARFSMTKGMRWITNGEQNKMLPPTEQLPDGWAFGRTKV